ncbi:MAG: DUF4143 domain-containing protein [Mycoplasmataceae bacterium]|nr:DUF4143 domain-containing protein [Mycoplasmataceae bacterium]
MKNKLYKPRIIDQILQQYISTFSAVLLEGPKWCGKSWTAKQISNSYINLTDPTNNFQNLKLLKLDIERSFIGEFPRTIDEWELLPSIWDALRNKIDDKWEGKIILTGSTKPERTKIFHSGAGRIAFLKMRPMSLYESNDSNGSVSLQDLFEHKKITGESNKTLDNLIDFILRGGWPENLNKTIEQALLFNRNYIEAISNERNIEFSISEYNKITMLHVIKSIARNDQTFVKNKTIMNETNISEPTLNKYFDILERFNLIESLPSWSQNLRSNLRIKKSSKIRLVDPSLSCAALGLTHESLLNDLRFLGFLFESLVVRDLLTYINVFDGKLFHLNQDDTDEVDLIVEKPNGDWGIIEVKLGASDIEKWELKLDKLIFKMINSGAKQPKFKAIISGISKYAYVTSKNTYVIPIACLRE